jgi:hypothetical protein
MNVKNDKNFSGWQIFGRYHINVWIAFKNNVILTDEDTYNVNHWVRPFLCNKIIPLLENTMTCKIFELFMLSIYHIVILPSQNNGSALKIIGFA